MGKRKIKENNINNTETYPMNNPVYSQSSIDKQNRPMTYVVIRDGYRVSDVEYETKDNPFAIAEMNFWNLVVQNHSYGEPVTIVQYDSKKHRVW